MTPKAANTPASPNFEFLHDVNPLLHKCAALAEKYVFDDPATALIKTREVGEMLGLEIAARVGITPGYNDTALGILQKLEGLNAITPKASQLFHGIRKAGNKATHEHVGERGEALYQLRMARELAIWFHKTFIGQTGVSYGPFVPPPDPADQEAALTAELEELRAKLREAEHAGKKESEKAQQLEQKVSKMYAELDAAWALAEETEEQWKQEKEQNEQYLAELLEVTKSEPPKLEFLQSKAQAADEEIELSEADTRKLIDSQLRDAGWEADTKNLRYKAGVRPQKNKNIAIAEWPTEKGFADYVLFVGLTPIAIVEAKRKNLDVASAIEQSKRYSKEFQPGDGWELVGGPWGEYKVPFMFSSNGRPFLRQVLTKSGTWFLDGRKPTNHPRALESWHTPEGLKGLLDIDTDAAEKKLADEPTGYLGLRDYQIDAVKAAEKAIADGKQTVMLAMATGTGKTRTCIGLTYRLLKAKRFRRILFLVDRTSLGEQATDAFNDVKLENLQAFSDIYDVKSLGDIVPEKDTRLHIATIQGLIRRLLYPTDDTQSLPIDLYDCVVVDECHRGYSLDRELSEGEMLYRGEKDYISKYTRVLDHFDAVKIGLTATPALHTIEIFGEPVYTYSYRQAVIDGHLIDHAPPIRMRTKLSEDGITWEAGDKIEVLKVKTGTIETITAPDEVTIEVDKFNTAVITEAFNRTVCGVLAQHIDPTLPGKTLIFCANDAHADLVVTLLKEAFSDLYGAVDDDAVQKITAAADKPLDKIRHYKNEKLPSVAVTVDLLTTGIDVPEIVNLVFIRRVKSRILYEQMIGRATRQCDAIGKELFYIYDAVDLYSAIEPYSTMKPVVTNPNISFVQLVGEIQKSEAADYQTEIRDQIVAKLQRKKRSMKQEELDLFNTITGKDLDQAINDLRSMEGSDINAWFSSHPDLPRWLDGVKKTYDPTILISDHEDEVREVAHGYGEHNKPEDYLESFREFVVANENKIPALIVVTTRPKDLTRKELKELKLLLDGQGYSETNLRTAWKDAKNEEIAASIIGFIRQMALGSPLIPYTVRVSRAMKKVLSSKPWTPIQRQWLERIGKQLEQETIVDKLALNSGMFKTQGGFTRLNKVFDGQMEAVLEQINTELWQEEAVA